MGNVSTGKFSNRSRDTPLNLYQTIFVAQVVRAIDRQPSVCGRSTNEPLFSVTTGTRDPLAQAMNASSSGDVELAARCHPATGKAAMAVTAVAIAELAPLHLLVTSTLPGGARVLPPALDPNSAAADC
jgi:hypothetical protein